MVRLARRETIDPQEVVVDHVCNRTVRKCFLMGEDEFVGSLSPTGCNLAIRTPESPLLRPMRAVWA